TSRTAGRRPGGTDEELETRIRDRYGPDPGDREAEEREFQRRQADGDDAVRRPEGREREELVDVRVRDREEREYAHLHGQAHGRNADQASAIVRLRGDRVYAGPEARHGHRRTAAERAVE